jgi:hypothetical protein
MTPVKSPTDYMTHMCNISLVSMTLMAPLKSQTDNTSTFSSFKMKIQQKYFYGNCPHTTVQYTITVL